MKRRNFLKYLSSIPLIGIPVKLLAKEKCGTSSITPLPDYLIIPDDETKPVIPFWTDPDDAVSLSGLKMKNGSTITFTEPVDGNYAGTKTWFDGEKMRQTRIARKEFYAGSEDPYEDVAKHIYKEYWKRKS